MYDNITVKYKDAEFIIGSNPIAAMRAIFLLKRRIKNGDTTAQNYAFLAEAYDTLFMKRKSFKCALKSIKLDRNYAGGYVIAGGILVDANKSEKAKQYLIKALNLAPENYSALFLLIISYINNDVTKQAWEYFQKFSGLTVDTPDYLMMKFFLEGCLYFFPQESSVGFCDIMKSYIKYKIIPDATVIILFTCLIFIKLMLIIFTYNSVINIACMLRQNEQYEFAVEFLLKMSGKYKKYKQSFYDEALDTYFDIEDYKKCIEVANRILIKDKNCNTYLKKSKCYRELKEYDKALENIDKAQKANKNPNIHNYNLLRVYVYIYAKNYKDALSLANQEILSNPSALAYRAKGECFFLMSNYKESANAFAKALELDENNEYLLFSLAKSYYFTGKNKDALSTINKALIIKKDYHNYVLKGDILSAMNKYKEANQSYAEASKLENG